MCSPRRRGDAVVGVESSEPQPTNIIEVAATTTAEANRWLRQLPMVIHSHRLVVVLL